MRIVLLGASGNAGREIARLLSPSLGAGDQLVLAGRDPGRLAATAAVVSGPAAVLIEQHIVDLFQLDQHEGPSVVVTGIPDPSKGEALVLLTTQDITPEQLRGKLLDAGLPNLWVPRIVRKVEKIPVLGTGKTDYQAVAALAAAADAP